MLVACLNFSLMGLCVKWGATDFGTTTLVFYRSLFGMVFLLIVARQPLRAYASSHWLRHIGRSASGLISLWLYFIALGHLPLATAVTLNYTSPLFLAAYLHLVHPEESRPGLILFLVMGFCGVLLLLHPHLTREQTPYVLIGLASGVGAGISYAQIRSMSRLGEPDWRVVFYFTTLSSAVTGCLLPYQPHISWTPSHIAILAGLGLFATLGQLTMTRAYRTGITLVVANLAYATIVFSSLLGMLLLQEHLSGETWLGMGIVILAGVASSRWRAS
jgi:EamA-like transporter family.